MLGFWVNYLRQEAEEAQVTLFRDNGAMLICAALIADRLTLIAEKLDHLAEELDPKVPSSAFDKLQMTSTLKPGSNPLDVPTAGPDDTDGK